MKILTLDTATRTGWALIANGIRSSGVSDFSIRTRATKTMEADHPGKRFHQFQQWLRETIRNTRPDLIVYERLVGGASSGGHTTLIQKGLEAVVQIEAYRSSDRINLNEDAPPMHIPMWTFAPATIKKWAINDGKLTHESKIAITSVAFHMFTDQEWVQTAKGVDDNQADALWILDLAVTVYKKCMVDGINPLEITDPETLTKLAGLCCLSKWSSRLTSSGHP